MGSQMIPSSEKLETLITAVAIGLRVLDFAQSMWRTIICNKQDKRRIFLELHS
jgi:hypothetical protein